MIVANRKSEAQRFELHEAIRRITADYLEMPDLSVTASQGARLWRIDSETCGRVLDQLAAEGFIARVGQRYTRR